MWECEHRNTSYFSSKHESRRHSLPYLGIPEPGMVALLPPRTLRLALRKYNLGADSGRLKRESRLLLNSLHAGPAEKVHFCQSCYSAVQPPALKADEEEEGEAGLRRQEGICCKGNVGNESPSPTPRISSSCLPFVLMLLPGPACATNICWVTTVCQAPEIKTDTSPCSHGASEPEDNPEGPLWGPRNEVTRWDNAGPCSSLPPHWSWGGEAEGLAAASKISKRLIYPTHAANVVWCFQKWRTNNLRFHLEAVNYSFSHHPEHQSVTLHFVAQLLIFKDPLTTVCSMLT